MAGEPPHAGNGSNRRADQDRDDGELGREQRAPRQGRERLQEQREFEVHSMPDAGPAWRCSRVAVPTPAGAWAKTMPQLFAEVAGRLAQPERILPGRHATMLATAGSNGRRSMSDALGAGRFVTVFLRRASFRSGSRRRARSMPAASLE